MAKERHAKAYFGVFRLVLGDEEVDSAIEKDADALVNLAREIDGIVRKVVAENTLNPGGIDAGIRKALLPQLFERFGLNNAKLILDQVVHIVRVGLNHD